MCRFAQCTAANSNHRRLQPGDTLGHTFGSFSKCCELFADHACLRAPPGDSAARAVAQHNLWGLPPPCSGGCRYDCCGPPLILGAVLISCFPFIGTLSSTFFACHCTVLMPKFDTILFFASCFLCNTVVCLCSRPSPLNSSTLMFTCLASLCHSSAPVCGIIVMKVTTCFDVHIGACRHHCASQLRVFHSKTFPHNLNGHHLHDWSTM